MAYIKLVLMCCSVNNYVGIYRKLQEQEGLAHKLESQCFNENDTKKVVEQLWYAQSLQTIHNIYIYIYSSVLTISLYFLLICTLPKITAGHKAIISRPVGDPVDDCSDLLLFGPRDSMSNGLRLLLLA